MVERTDDHPGTGSATYCSALSLRQASRTLVLAQRSYANNATTSSCMRISPGLGDGGAEQIPFGACLVQVLGCGIRSAQIIHQNRGFHEHGLIAHRSAAPFEREARW